MKVIESRHGFQLTFEPQKRKLSLCYSLNSIPVCTSTLLKEKSCMSGIKAFFLTLFNWKWIKVKDSNLLVNVNSLAKKMGIQPNEVRALAHLGKGALFDAVHKKHFGACPSYLAVLKKADDHFKNEPRKAEAIEEIRNLLHANGYHELPTNTLYIAPRPAWVGLKDSADLFAKDEEATQRMNELYRMVDGFLRHDDVKFALIIPQ